MRVSASDSSEVKFSCSRSESFGKCQHDHGSSARRKSPWNAGESLRMSQPLNSAQAHALAQKVSRAIFQVRGAYRSPESRL